MKKIARLFSIVTLITGCSIASLAQNPLKIGYVDFNTLLAAMPGIDSVKIKLQAYQKTLTDQMDKMKAEFETKYSDYQSQASTMSELIKQTKGLVTAIDLQADLCFPVKPVQAVGATVDTLALSPQTIHGVIHLLSGKRSPLEIVLAPRVTFTGNGVCDLVLTSVDPGVLGVSTELPGWVEALLMAYLKAKLGELSMSYITGDAEITGHNGIKPGIVVKLTVNLKTASDRFNGKYLVRGCTHHYSHQKGEDGGYKTIIRVGRDGDTP